MIKRIVPVCFYTQETGELGKPEYTFIKNHDYKFNPKEKQRLPGALSVINVDGVSYIVVDIYDEGTFREDGVRTRIIVKSAYVVQLETPFA